MRVVFGDTFYWIALTDPGDQWHHQVKNVSQGLGPLHILTTEPVLIELLNHFSAAGAYWRQRALAMVDTICQNPQVEVLAYEPRVTLRAGLELYAARPDKSYSLTDCISICEMRRREIFEVLTHDEHFAQEGFILLL